MPHRSAVNRTPHCVSEGCEHDGVIETPDDHSWFSPERFPEPAGRLTGITLTPQLLEESTYLCGGVPESR